VHIPGVQSFESALALKRVVYRTNLPLRQGVSPSRHPRV
jgi:Lrp/AsnC family transcriptional regulator, leucine-responsive regulatory protein